jgi:hypothetical protein
MSINNKLKSLFYKSWRRNFTIEEITYVRILLYGVVLYKLLSRDFSNFGYIPQELLNFYPINHYAQDLRNFSGIKLLVDILTFHWIHWFLSFPSEYILKIVQSFTILLVLITIIFGAGKKNIFSIFSYLFLIYLWGYLYRSSTDFEGTQLILQICFLFCFFDKGDKNLINLFKKTKEDKNIKVQKSRNTFFFLMTLLVGSYYFNSGLHKFYDLSLSQWFQYDLTQTISMFIDQMELGNFRHVPQIFKIIPENNYLNYFGSIFIYVSHIFAFLMIFNRDSIKNFLYIYVFFHLTVYGVGINFLGNVFVFMLFIPISYFKENIFSIDYKNFDSHQNLIKVLSKKVKFNKKEMRGFDYKYLIIKDNSNNYYTDLYAVRRLLWISPLFFLFNLLLYLPIFNIRYFGTKNGSS